MFAKRNKNKFIYVTLTALISAFLFNGQVQVVSAQVVPVNDKELGVKIDESLKIQKQLNQSLGYQPDSFAISLEDRLTAVKNTISFSMPVDVEGEIVDGIDFDAVQKCHNAIDKIGQGSDIESLSITSALKPSVWAGIIGGGKAEAAQLTAQAQEYGQYILCIQEYLTKIKDPKYITVRNLNEANRLNNYITLYSDALTKLDAKVVNLRERASAGWKDIAKAVLLTTIMKVNQNVTTNLINRAIDKYKINDYLKYADAVATQIYSMKYIDQNYTGDEEKKMVLRSILANSGTEQVTNLLKVSAEKRAQDFLSKVCDPAKGAYDYGNMQYLKCMAMQASAEASPVYQTTTILEEAGAAKVAGQQAARDEMTDGKGYAPVRNCFGTVDQQKMIDNEWTQAATDLQVSKETNLRVLQSATINLDEIDKANISPADKQKLIDAQKAEVAKAQKAADDAQKAYENLKTKRVSGNIVDICEAIASPASFIANSLDSFLKQHLDQATQLRTENLPFFAKFFSDVAGNFLSKIILGAFNNNSANAKVVKESGVKALTGAVVTDQASVNSMVSAANTSATQNTTIEGVNGNVDIYVYPEGGDAGNRTLILDEGKSYVLVVDFKQLLSQGVTSMKVEGIESLSGQSSDSGVVQLNDQQKQTGQITTNVSGIKSGFTLTVNFYKDEILDGAKKTTDLGSYSQTFGFVPTNRRVIEVPPPIAAETPPTDLGTTGEQTGQGTTGEIDTGDGSQIKGASIILPRGPVFAPRG